MFAEIYYALSQILCLMTLALVSSMFMKHTYKSIRDYLRYVEKKAWG